TETARRKSARSRARSPRNRATSSSRFWTRRATAIRIPDRLPDEPVAKWQQFSQRHMLRRRTSAFAARLVDRIEFDPCLDHLLTSVRNSPLRRSPPRCQRKNQLCCALGPQRIQSTQRGIDPLLGQPPPLANPLPQPGYLLRILRGPNRLRALIVPGQLVKPVTQPGERLLDLGQFRRRRHGGDELGYGLAFAACHALNVARRAALPLQPSWPARPRVRAAEAALGWGNRPRRQARPSG